MTTRNKGTFEIAASFEVKTAGKFDAREYCKTYDELLEYTGADFLPNGFSVNVWDTNPDKRGIYFLIDNSKLVEPTSWKRIAFDGEGGDSYDHTGVVKVDPGSGKISASLLPALGLTKQYASLLERDSDISLENVTFGLVMDTTGDPDTDGETAMYVLTSGNEWILFDTEGVDLSGGVSPEDIVADVTSGAWEAGSKLNKGSSVWDAIKKFVSKTFYPTLVSPTFSMSSGGESYRVIGSTTNLPLSLGYNAGSILGLKSGGVWNAGSTQNPRAGAATSYKFKTGTGSLITSQATNAYTVNNYVTVAGANTFKGSIAYGAGVQPKDSTDANYDAPFPAGDSVDQVTSFEGVYPVFAATVTSGIANFEQLPLVSNQNGSVFIIDSLAAETSVKQRIIYPKKIVDNGKSITKIEYWNPVSGSFDPANKIADFTLSDTTKLVESVAVDYKLLTHNGSDRGAIKVRVTIS